MMLIAVNTVPPPDRTWMMIRHADPERPIGMFSHSLLIHFPFHSIQRSWKRQSNQSNLPRISTICLILKRDSEIRFGKKLLVDGIRSEKRERDEGTPSREEGGGKVLRVCYHLMNIPLEYSNYEVETREGE